MKGVDIIVKGNVGHMSAFMAQKGNLVIFGDAGHALGDSIYEANIYVAGEVASLGADCIEKKMTKKHLSNLENILSNANVSDYNTDTFRRFGSARSLYNFDVDNAKIY
jgi:glutamate synthase domain-containing protein 3